MTNCFYCNTQLDSQQWFQVTANYNPRKADTRNYCSYDFTSGVALDVTGDFVGAFQIVILRVQPIAAG